MELNAKINLSSNKTHYDVHIVYNTFTKATYDSYLVATVVANSKSENEAEQYFKDICGNGSLFPHFMKLYKRFVREYDEETIKKILSSSLYPTTCIDDSKSFEYYKEFDISKFDGEIYEGNLCNQKNIIIKSVIHDDEQSELKVCEINVKNESIDKDVYDVDISDDYVDVYVSKVKTKRLTSDVFSSMVNIDLKNIDGYIGEVQKDIDLSSTNWNMLDKVSLDYICKKKMSFAIEGNQYSIDESNLLKYVIIKLGKIYFFREIKVGYNEHNRNIIDKVVEQLKQSPILNEVKTKTLIKLLRYCNDINAQEVINYILNRKDSKEIALLGLEIAKRGGLEKNWSANAQEAFKTFVTNEYVETLYKINPNFKYSLVQLQLINKEILLPEHADIIAKAIEERRKILDMCNQMVGEMVNSASRENNKKLDKNKVTLEFNNFCKKFIGHKKNPLESLDDNRLQLEYKEIERVYTKIYPKIKESLDRLDKKL